MILLEAFAHQEGFYVTDSRPQRNNNPLDLEAGPEATKFGATGTDGRFAIFPDVETGFKAGQSWLSVPAKFAHGLVQGLFLDPNGTTLVAGYLGATMAQVVHRFAPSSENNTEAYLNYLCLNVGVNPEDVMTLEMLELSDLSSVAATTA